MTYQFKFRTNYTFEDGKPDNTVYTAHLVGMEYRVVVEQGDYTAYVELPLREVFEKVISREWLVVQEEVCK